LSNPSGERAGDPESKSRAVRAKSFEFLISDFEFFS